MLLLDTHIWIWWQTLAPEFTQTHQKLIDDSEFLAVSQISIWEIAKLVEKNRLNFTVPLKEWLEIALSHSKLKVISLNTDIIIESTQLPKPFHQDPADQLIVATARVLNIPLLTEDKKIQVYPFYTRPS